MSPFQEYIYQCFPWEGHIVFQREISIHTTREQKESKKSRGLEMLSDIENLDIMLGENHFNPRERYESLNSNLARRPESSVSNDFENEGENAYLDPGIANFCLNTDFDRNSATVNSSADINRLSSELNSRVSGEMDEMMNSVNVRIQRAISDAISNQVLPQIQNAIMAGSGHMTKKGWNVPGERPEINPKHYRSEKTKSNFRSELTRDCFLDNHQEQAYDSLRLEI